MFLPVSGSLIVELIVAHGIVVTSHHLDVLDALKAVLTLIRVVPLLVGKLSDCIQNRACARGSDFPMCLG